MPLRLTRAHSNATLWRACVDRFLDANAECTGPTGYAARLWVTHRLHRDCLYQEAARRGHPGWLDPPVSFFSDLPRLFDLRLRPIGSLRRRLLLADIAAVHAAEHGIALRSGAHAGSAAGIDGLIGNLLAESVSASQLERALTQVEHDDFARRRNAWILATYKGYLDTLAQERRFDPRGIHGFVAGRISQGALAGVLGGASTLHIYGLHSVHTRRRLLEAFRDQEDVSVVVYLAADEEAGEWSTLGVETEALDEGPGPTPHVQPAPDGRRELEYVALEAKKLIVEQGVPPERIGVIARTGRDDTWRAHEILERAGVPTTARVRSSLAEVPAIKAVLHLLRATARGWPYRSLRQVIESAYFDIDIDLRTIDRIAQERRVEGLEAWQGELDRLVALAAANEEERERRSEGLFPDRLARDRDAFAALANQVAPLSADRSIAQWLDVTAMLLDPGWFDFRERLCRRTGGHWEVVRLDQQAVHYLARLLAEWRGMETGSELLTPDTWHRRLQVFLRANELAVGTPQQTGVQILEAHEASLVPFDATFVIHANDGVFPARAPVSSLFSEEEREALFPQGIPVAPYEIRQRRERGLWRAVAQNASVTISYRTADANGVPLLHSVMVPAHDQADEIPRTQFVWDDPFNADQADLAAMRRLHEARTKGTPVRAPMHDVTAAQRAVVSAVAEIARREARSDAAVTAGDAGPWNGLIRDPAVLEVLARRFGPDRVWSASQLESYTQCPFVYFIDRVLYLQDTGEAEEDTTALTFGGAAHDILERFYGEYAGEYVGGLDPPSRALLERIAAEVFAKRESEASEWLGLPVLWEVRKLDLVQRLVEYLDWELTKQFAGRRPYARELSFGDDDGLMLSGRSLMGASVTLPVRGRVDRVDVESDGSTFHIVDYKSGGTPSPKGYNDGSAIQMPLYMEAVSKQLDATVASGVYRSIKGKANGARLQRAKPAFQNALSIALSVPERVRAGYFEACATEATKWQRYWPSPAVCRTAATLPAGTSRFDV